MANSINYGRYYDKVLGGWIGKCAGGILGAPIEGFKKFNRIELSDKLFETNFANDDLDLQVLWLDMVKQKGPLVRETDFVDHWRTHVEFPWGEYGVASRNLKLGLSIPASGSHNNWYWKTGMGCPIRSELWGMLCPGMPEQAAYYARLDASLDHDGFSVDAEMFLSACAALAFFEENLEVIFQEALKVVDADAELHLLVDQCTSWYKEGGWEVAMGKVKSYWGDADFTYAPMNVGLTLLALLHSGCAFSGMMEALHCGHDSDCIVATAGALIGIIKGYEKIDPRWKAFVKDELLVSPEIVTLNHANTVTGLTRDTCQAGLDFTAHYSAVEITSAPPTRYQPRTDPIHINLYPAADVVSLFRDAQALVLATENRSSVEQALTMAIASPYLDFSQQAVSLRLRPGQKNEQSLTCRLKDGFRTRLEQGMASGVPPSLSYTITAQVEGHTYTSAFGLPFYGRWMLLGPFIEEDPSLVPMDATYPDHGLPSLPSVRYMNHDRVNTDQDFLTVEEVRALVASGEEAQAPFMVQKIYPSSGRFHLNQYFKGKGERTLYLYTRFTSPTEAKKWLALGCSAYFKLWFNGEQLHEQTTLQRSWPAAVAKEVVFQSGVNDLLLKIDMVVDHLDFEFGIKDHPGKHPHQSHWDTSLVAWV